MRRDNATKIYFCLPDTTLPNKEKVVDVVVSEVKWDKNIGFAGFLKRSYLKDYLSRRLTPHKQSAVRAKTHSAADKKRIEKTIRETTARCKEKLPLPSPLFVFVFPWPGSTYDKAFGGVTGFTPYASTVHMFLSQQKFSIRSLKETVAHEYNHAAFFHHHTSAQSLLDTLIFEGLAENFREEVVRGRSSRWSHALSTKESEKVLRSLRQFLKSSTTST